MRHGSLFSGIGGFDLAAEWMGWENVFHTEINEFAKKVLKKNFPDSISYGDITKTDFTIHRGNIDIVTGGWPCPKYSNAGKQRGNEPLKQHLINTTKIIYPKWFLFENVPGLITPKLSQEHHQLLNEMESFGYETITFSISADTVGAKQIRERIWIVGRNKVGENSDTSGGQLGGLQNALQQEGAQNRTILPGNPFGLSWYEAISGVHGIFNGLSRRMDAHRNRTLGNAIVPQVALEIFKAIEQYEKSKPA